MLFCYWSFKNLTSFSAVRSPKISPDEKYKDGQNCRPQDHDFPTLHDGMRPFRSICQALNTRSSPLHIVLCAEWRQMRAQRCSWQNNYISILHRVYICLKIMWNARQSSKRCRRMRTRKKIFTLLFIFVLSSLISLASLTKARINTRQGKRTFIIQKKCLMCT